jgi:type III restriction enzyme
MKNDKWKEEFLKVLRQEKQTFDINSDKYLITGIPFYNYDNENEIKDILEDDVLQLND